MADIRGERASENPTSRGRRRDTIVPEAGHDAYRLTTRFAEPSRCAACGALFRDGRWSWPKGGFSVAGAVEVTCPACRRIADGYPAGFLTLSGKFLQLHRGDILAAVRATEQLEAGEHPLHRIISTEEQQNQILITTTDVHLPRRLAESIDAAFHGELDISYASDDEVVRISWQRDDPHPPAAHEAKPPLAIEVKTNGQVVASDANAYLSERITRIAHFFPAMLACRVVVDAPSTHQRSGGLFGVAIHVELPGADVHVTRRQAEHLHAAIRLAFDALHRQLEDRGERLETLSRRPRGEAYEAIESPLQEPLKPA